MIIQDDKAVIGVIVSVVQHLFTRKVGQYTTGFVDDQVDRTGVPFTSRFKRIVHVSYSFRHQAAFDGSTADLEYLGDLGMFHQPR